MKLSRVIFAIGPLLAMVAFAPAQAQSWPSRPVTIVAPYPAGGTPDLIARAIAEKMGALLGSPVVVDRRWCMDTAGTGVTPTPQGLRRQLLKCGRSSGVQRSACG